MSEVPNSAGMTTRVAAPRPELYPLWMLDPTIARRLGQIRGSVVAQLSVDHACTLALDPSDDAQPLSALRIEGDFAYRGPSGGEHAFSGDYPRTSLGPVLDLFGATVVAVEVSPGGDLTLDFDSTARIHVPVSPHFEAWVLSARGAATLVSPPGGSLPVWPMKEYGSGES